MLRRVALAVILMLCTMMVTQTSALDATFVLKTGERVSGQMAYRSEARIYLVIEGRERAFPLDDIAIIAFVPGDPSRAELAQLPGDNPPELQRHMMVFRDGQILHGKMYHFDMTCDCMIIDTQDGQRRSYNAANIARIYMSGSGARGVYHYVPGSAAEPEQPPAPSGQGYRVDGNRPWTDTGMSVRRGERITFVASGEIRVGTGPGMTAGPDGNGSIGARRTYPVPQMPVGGLIGRVGNGRPFPIGSGTSPILMPDSGQLSIGINDDVHSDNSGAFEVRIQR